jgi:hypothetical protein
MDSSGLTHKAVRRHPIS